MSVTTIEPEITHMDSPTETPGEAPPIFGRCPVCKKPLRPRCRYTGEPKAPPVGTGYESRAKCSGCGTIICYIGNGEWRVLTEADLTEDDHFANKMGF
jgi:hypothetical protein